MDSDSTDTEPEIEGTIPHGYFEDVTFTSLQAAYDEKKKKTKKPTTKKRKQSTTKAKGTPVKKKQKTSSKIKRGYECFYMLSFYLDFFLCLY